MFGIKFNSAKVVQVPRRFNANTMDKFISSFVDEDGDAEGKSFEVDFSGLEFVDPVAIVVMSNLIEYLRQLKIKVQLTGLTNLSEGVLYLDDCGFFKQYQGASLRAKASLRDTTIPLKLVANPTAVGFLHGNLIPWIAQRLHTTAIALATLRVTLEEVFHNISDHSGVNVGCVFVQHFPKIDEIHIAISDFGYGIPKNVRKVRPEANDQESLVLAITEGFTTKSNVKNRGAGLAILMNYVALRNGGTVILTSGRGNLSAVYDRGKTKITARSREVYYPGTLVNVILKTNALKNVTEDVEDEEFSW